MEIRSHSRLCVANFRLALRKMDQFRGTWRGHSSAGRAPALHAGGRRFDPVWLHQFLGNATAEHRVSKRNELISFEDSLLFNNLENSDVLMGQFLIDSHQVSHLHVARHGSTLLNRNAVKQFAQKETVKLYFAQSSLGYMVKRLSACGGCLGSKRR